jgi:hypothetical protein
MGKEIGTKRTMWHRKSTPQKAPGYTLTFIEKKVMLETRLIGIIALTNQYARRPWRRNGKTL